MTALTFSSLGLDNWLTQQIENVGLKEPTPVQQNCIPPILQGTIIEQRNSLLFKCSQVKIVLDVPRLEVEKQQPLPCLYCRD